MKTFFAAVALTFGAIATARDAGDPEPPTIGNVWSRVSPAEANMDADLLDEAMSYPGRPGAQGSETYCVSVHRDGKLVADRYFKKRGQVGDTDGDLDVDEFTPLVVWSTSKAVTHTIVGIAEKAGLLKTTDQASDYIMEWKRSNSSEVLVDMLMRMDSGRYYDPVTDFVLSQFEDLVETMLRITRLETTLTRGMIPRWLETPLT